MRRALNLVADNEERSDAPETQALFEDRVQEFWDVVRMCLTSPREDQLTHTYQSGAMPKPLNRWGFWCPIAEPQQELANWMDYNPPVREAIRRSFRRGIGRLTDWDRPETLENWLSYEPGLMYKMPPYIEIIGAEAKKTGQYALAQARMELLLNDIYQEAKHIPYHPAFDRAFKNKLTYFPLHSIGPYIKQMCIQPYNREMLDNLEGRSYLHDLVTEVADKEWSSHPSKVQRAYEALCCDDIVDKKPIDENHLSANSSQEPTNESNTIESPWEALLIGDMSVEGFFAFLHECGLLNSLGHLTPLGKGTDLGKANKAPWAGALKALMDSKLLFSNAAAVCRALESVDGLIGIKINEGTIRNSSKTADSKYFNSAIEILKKQRQISS